MWSIFIPLPHANLKVDILSTFNITDWFDTNGNEALANTSDLQVNAPFNLTAPNPMPMGGSPLLSGASFSDPLLTQLLPDLTLDHPASVKRWTAYLAKVNEQETLPDLPAVEDGKEKRVHRCLGLRV